MTVQLQDIRDRALRVIAYGSAKVMQEFLAEIDPNGYYPKAEKHNDLWIHIARVMCAREQGQEEPLPFAECVTCSDLDMCQNLGFSESVEECELYPEEETCPHDEVKHILATISKTGCVECVACGEKLDWYEWAHIHSKKEAEAPL